MKNRLKSCARDYFKVATAQVFKPKKTFMSPPFRSFSLSLSLSLSLCFCVQSCLPLPLILNGLFSRFKHIFSKPNDSNLERRFRRNHLQASLYRGNHHSSVNLCCCPRFESQEHHLHFKNIQILCYICRCFEKRTKIIKKRPVFLKNRHCKFVVSLSLFRFGVYNTVH